MGVKYLDRADIIRYLDRTICTWDGHPYFVMSNGDGSNGDLVTICKLDGRARKYLTIDHTDKKFSDRSVPLGYLNYNGVAYYLRRIPYRRQNQSINVSCIASTPNLRDDGYWFLSPEMEACILGKHTTYEKAIDQLNKYPDYHSFAIHRYVAVGRVNNNRFGLYFKGRLVAHRQGNAWEYLSGQDTSFAKKTIERLGVLK